jgi:predicted metalloprotease with PDZ domain
MNTGENHPTVIYFHPKNAPKLAPARLVLPGLTRPHHFYWVLTGFTKIYQVLPGLLSLNIDLPDNKVRQSLLG